MNLNGHTPVSPLEFRQFIGTLLHECSTRPNVRSTNQWDDQRNLLHNLHPLEGKMFERSIHFFFDREYGCYVYDDELLASKATNVEL
jgi:hypothetical protein